MKIESIKSIGKHEVYDIETESHDYVLSNGVITHNSGGMLSADQVFIVGKRQIKEGTDLVGWQFILNAEKSRTIREKSAIPFEVKYDGGMDRYSGLLDIGLASGFVTAPKKGWFTRPSVSEDKNWRRKDTSCEEFWKPLLGDQKFLDTVSSMYKVGGNGKLLQDKLDGLLNEGEDLDLSTGEITQTE